jgi:hypothetical protein
MNTFSDYKAAWISIEDSAWCSIWEAVRGSVVYSAWSSNITKFPAMDSVEINISIATEEYVRNEL